ncbi:MAG: MarR family transcriptional regulator [Actinomycetota bacterium]|nr:MarR family transcriptional regulator [Actinomycetota bacterium]
MRLLERFNVQADHFVAAAGDARNLHRSDLRALSAMRAARAEGATAGPGALAAALDLSTPATSALLDRLSRSGHVVRKRAVSDGRRVELEITESAIALATELFAALRSHLVPQIESFSEGDREVIARFLVAVTEATAQAREAQARS